MSERECLEPSSSSVFEKIIVARILATWYAADGSVAVQITNLVIELLYLLVYVLVSYSLCQQRRLINCTSTLLRKLLNQLMNSLKPNLSLKVPCPKHLLILSLQLTRKLMSQICAHGTVLSLPCPCQSLVVAVFALSMSELGRCTNAEATFPLPTDTRPIDRTPYRANPRAKAVIDKCVHDMLEWDIIEERPSPWGSPYSCRKEERKPSFLC